MLEQQSAWFFAVLFFELYVRRKILLQYSFARILRVFILC